MVDILVVGEEVDEAEAGVGMVVSTVLSVFAFFSALTDKKVRHCSNLVIGVYVICVRMNLLKINLWLFGVCLEQSMRGAEEEEAEATTEAVVEGWVGARGVVVRRHRHLVVGLSESLPWLR